MKVATLEKLIKKIVKEAIREELGDILIESLKTNKLTPIHESHTPQLSSVPPTTHEEMRAKYMGVLDDMSMSFTSQDAKPKFTPTPGSDTINGALPEGEVDMSQIMSLMGGK